MHKQQKMVMAEAKLYQIKPAFAAANNLPVAFVAVPIRETTKAVKLFGKGTITKHLGFCSICGRTLTEKTSIQTGIGPVCAEKYGIDRATYNAADAQKIADTIQAISINTWVPKSCISDVSASQNGQKIELPVPKTTTEPKKPAKKVGRISKKTMKITFAYDPKLVALVKSFPGRKYHPNGKFWTCPINPVAIEQLKTAGFEIDKELLPKDNNNKRSAIKITGLKLELMPFQKTGVEFIEVKEGRVLIADEMGLGKTAQALAWLALHPKERPAVVVCPASLKFNWLEEINKWMKKPGMVQVLSGRKPQKNKAIYGDIIIINYDILPNKYIKKGKRMIEQPFTGWVDYLLERKPKVVVLDESHYIKNSKAMRTKAACKLAKHCSNLICLTGTPILNRPVEIFNTLNAIDASLFPSFWRFAQRYCGAKHNGWGWNFNGASRTKELNQLLSHIMIRRTKKEVLSELPDKQRTTIPLELANKKEYQQIKNNFLAWLIDKKGTQAAKKASKVEQLTKVEYLKQAAARGKLKAAIKWIENVIENEKLVVFATHKEIIDQLTNHFDKEAVKIDGSTTQAKRKEAVDRFQKDSKVKLFIGNIKAAGVGITLTAASKVAFLELPWTPGELIQAEDRCHRIGQKNAVNIYYLVGLDTIDSYIANLLKEKAEVIEKVVDGKASTTEVDILKDLYKYMEEK